MSKLLRAEIDEALEEYRQAQAAIDHADLDFIEAAVYRYKAAECQLDALVRQAKVIQFPLTQSEPEVKVIWQERVMDWIANNLIVPAAIVFGAAVIVSQIILWRINN